jgi:hypothetical protein
MSEIVHCEDTVHNAKVLNLSEAPTPKAELHIAYEVSYPLGQIPGATQSETHIKRLCSMCWERIEADLNTIVSGLGDKVTLRMEVSTI